ncbi:M23 family metallopeptidase [Sporosarcina thermotolerans]|uniref:M23 family metallopeptidase n=1 Tax=Sporosarcina thermotolerans TaxID=633404 RepID=A0AAW9A5L8_9BACL|nr:M23 family metallopeptidase [Sporosarcina thermotolerans]MDW0116492.1 M23 family metallopeptidase [Sporosarcina thermotolerans]
MFFNRKEKKEDKSSNFIYRRLQKVGIITATLFATIGIGSGFAFEKAEDASIHTVYHVYSDGKYVGMLSDEKQIEQLTENKLQKAAEDFDGLPLTIGTELSVVPENVFTVETDDKQVLGKLQNMLTVEAEAIGIKIDEETSLYVKDMAEYDEVIQTLTLQTVSQEELAEFEARNQSTEPIPPLKEDETRLVKIHFSADLQPVKGQVEPESVRSVQEIVTLLNKGTLEDKKYEVQAGDVLGKIASAHNMTTAKLMEQNPGVTENSLLQIGQELNVTVLEPLVEVEAHYESKKVETIKFSKLTEKDESQFKGEKKLKQKGSDGKKSVTQLTRMRNGNVIGRSVVEEDVLVESVPEITLVGTKVIPSRGTGKFMWPADGGYVSSQMGKRWGRVHQGIDIARPSSRSIFAADNGVVTNVGRHGTYGNRIIITHNNGYKTLYAHLAKMDVKVGQTVPKGTKIGVMGSTGRSTGMHLHFEVYKNGSNINPLSVLR